jgi:hypothetical protein
MPELIPTSLRKIYTTRTTIITTPIIALFCPPLRSPKQLKAMMKADILFAFFCK